MSKGGPKWARKLWTTKPRRRANKHLCKQTLKEEAKEDVAWPLGNSKPNELFWRL